MKSKPKKMLKGELKKYKALLIEQKKRFLDEFMHIKNDVLNANMSQKDASGDLSGYSYHMADMASDQYERDFLLRLASDERERLYAIDEALKRIDDGAYGKCLKCSKAITKKRLKALPQTPYCIKCQEEEEKSKTG